MTTNRKGEKQNNYQNGKSAEINKAPDHRQKQNFKMNPQIHPLIQAEQQSETTESAG